MKVITRKALAATAAERWKKQYYYSSGWGTTNYGCTKEVYDKMVALGENPDPKKIDEIIGNDSWTSDYYCNECDSQSEIIIQLGEEPHYESSTAYVCFDCLKKAMELASKE